jgi:drug/metabolite transporter (DMT)-like permease
MAVVVATAIWGASSVFVKLAHTSGVVFALYRLWGTFGVLWLALLIRRERLHWRVLRIALPAGLAFGFNTVLFFTALRKTSVADATLITALQPLLVLAVAARWMGERVGLRTIVWSAASVIGAVVVVVGSSATPAWSAVGDMLAFGAVACFTAYVLISKHVRAQVGPHEYLTGVMLVASVAITPVAVLSGDNLRAVEARDWLWIILYTVLSGAIGHLLINWAHATVDVHVSTLIMMGVPVVATLTAVFALGESLNAVQVLGGVIVIGAIAAVLRGSGSGVAPMPAADVIPPPLDRA